MDQKRQPQIIVVQPNIQVPFPADRLKWVEWLNVHTQWLRAVGPQLALDEKKLVLGNVLQHIIEYDINAFPPKDKDSTPFSTSIHGLAHDQIFARIDAEIALPELPQHIKNKLLSVKEEFGKLDWSTPQGVAHARLFWDTEVRTFVRTHTYADPTLSEALDYYTDNWTKLLEKPYQEFLVQHNAAQPS
jgi:hypothetical protein